MIFDLRPGNAIGCDVSSHRARWNGTICRNASSWECGANLDFRQDYCDRGDSRCYHIHNFSPTQPRLSVHSSGGDWVFEANPRAFDDQVLLLWGKAFREPHGIPAGQVPEYHLFGAYRVQRVERVSIGHAAHNWLIFPYADGWAECSGLRLARPRFDSMAGKYFKEVERSSVLRMFDLVRERASAPGCSLDSDTVRRVLGFCDSLRGWLEIAEEEREPLAGDSSASRKLAASGYKPFRDLTLKDIPAATKPLEEPAPPVERAKANVVPAKPALAPTQEGLQPLIAPARYEELRKRFSKETVNSLLLGSLSKPLLILRGSPGVGKSYTAIDLIEDPERQRTLIVAVGSTWRGREDLLGYVNPVDDLFSPTEVTRFLIRAAKAWDAGDRRPWVVVLEEFNLSQPEHWMSDLLVRSQYPPEPKALRTIVLGGKKLNDGGEASFYLSPAVRWIATINSDHTTRALSPRVLDRAAVVHLELAPSEALTRAGVKLEPGQVDAISELDFLLRELGATFSFRTARSLALTLDRGPELGLDSWGILDYILVQEVLSKVQLLAADPGDQRALEKLIAWSEGSGSALSLCGKLITGWSDLLEAGRDVGQA